MLRSGTAKKHPQASTAKVNRKNISLNIENNLVMQI
jgi:hypothetical protein